MAIASLISASVFPFAKAYSISASEMASLEPKASKSFVNGMSSFFAISRTFSVLVSDLGEAAYLLLLLLSNEGSARRDFCY